MHDEALHWAKKADLSSLLLTQCIHSISDKPECMAGHPNSAASASAIATVGVAPRQETEVMQASMQIFQIF